VHTLPQLLKHPPRLSLVRMLLEKLIQQFARLIALAVQNIDTREIQIRLIKGWSYTDTSLEGLNGFIRALRNQIQHA
jgi:hypothetical protein